MPLGGLESPPALAGLEVSLLEESYASTLRPNLPLCFKFLGKLIDETERDGKDTREIEEDEVEVEEDEETNWGVKKGFSVNEYMII